MAHVHHQPTVAVHCDLNERLVWYFTASGMPLQSKLSDVNRNHCNDSNWHAMQSAMKEKNGKARSN